MSWPIKSISLAASGPWLVAFWGALGLALALAVWAYRAPVPPLPRSSRILLGTLRFLALAILILTLFQPVLTVASRGSDRPELPVLLDVSASMRQPAGAGLADSTTRFALARGLVVDLLPDLEREFEVHVYGFGVTAAEVAGGEALASAVPAEPATDLGSALRAVLSDEAVRPAAIVVVSDGAVNRGPDPVALAERGAVPLIAVPVSLDSTVNDVRVAECLANRTAYLGQETVVSITLASSLAMATRVGVILSEDDRILTREHVAIPAGAARVPVEIRFRPDRLGVHRYTVNVESVPGEFTTENNRRTFAVRVQEERLQVLLIADRPTWDLTFIRRALASDRTLALSALVRLSSDGSYQPLGGSKLAALPARPRELAAFGTVVLVGVDVAGLPAATRAALAGFAGEGGGLLVVAPPRPAGGRSELERILPARPSPDPLAPSLVASSLTPAGSVHPVTGLGESPSRAEQLWEDLPPVRPSSALDIGLSGEVLVESSGTSTRLPLVVAGRTPGGRAMVVNATLVWRWGFLVAGSTGDDLVHRRFWSEAVRWLARGEGGGNLEVFADQPAFLQGQRVTLGARLTDDELKPVPDAAVSVEFERVDMGTAGTDTRQDRPGGAALGPAEGLGSYAGDAGQLPPGLYRLSGRAKRGAQEWKSEGGHFVVDEARLEGTTPEANPDLMRRLALRTGGAVVTLDEARGAIAALVKERALAERTVEIKLWNHVVMFAAFVGCTSLEWFLRRRRGLA